MRKRKKNFPFLFIGLTTLGALLYLVASFDPGSLVDFTYFHVPVLFFFFILFFASVATLGTFFFLSVRRGVLLSIFITGILLLRFMGYTNPFYILLLLCVVLLFEFGLR